ncbi:MAG: Mur ligase family protein, partial [Candidatus Dormibacteria bacterium]
MSIPSNRPDPRLWLAIVAGKVSSAAIRRLGRGGGTTVPGRVGLAVDPGALAKIAARLPHGAVLVSGTNGKTTTASLLREILESSGLTVVSNRAGSNLAWGLAAAVVGDSRPGGRPRADIGVFEVDEGMLPSVSASIRPRAIVVTNLFRDQLDRYGELEASSAAVGAALAALPVGATAVLCADDPGVANLGENLRARVVGYGLDDPSLGQPGLAHAADAKFCPRCGEPYVFARVYVGHMGHFRCSTGDTQRRRPDLSVISAAFDGLRSQRLTLQGLGFESTEIDVPLSGLYNTYNVAAACATAAVLGVAPSVVERSLTSFRPSFGRLEQVEAEGRRLHLLLA